MRKNTAAAFGQFLQDLGQLTQLAYLHLEASLDPAAAYTALTASSKLHTLCLEECKLPPSIWQHMLAANRHLPDLQNLKARGYEEPSALGADNLLGFVSCCPNLPRLDVPHCGSWQLLKDGEPAESLLPVASLICLRHLAVRHVSDTADDAALQVLAQLTGLTALHIDGGRSSRVTAVGLLHLATLRQIKSRDLRVPLCDDTCWFYSLYVSGLHAFCVVTTCSGCSALLLPSSATHRAYSSLHAGMVLSTNTLGVVHGLCIAHVFTMVRHHASLMPHVVLMLCPRIADSLSLMQLMLSASLLTGWSCLAQSAGPVHQKGCPWGS